MGGIVLYLFTLVLETISVVVRFLVVRALVGWLGGEQLGLVLGLFAALAPVLYSLAVLAGLPSGHLLVRWSLHGRPLSADERRQLDLALAAARRDNLPVPQRIFALDERGLNAAISGRTMYVFRELFESPFLPGVIAHELGHYNSLDGRLLLAIRGLTIPGGFVIANLLLGVLQWVAYGLLSCLIGLFVIVFLLLRINVWAVMRSLFGISVQLARFTIIFAVGGVGSALLGSLWRSYFIEREYAADAYAGRLGYARDLITFFETEILSDLVIPWYSEPSHPPATRRIAALEELLAHYPQQAGPRVRPQTRNTRSSGSPAPAMGARAAAAMPHTRQAASPRRWPRPSWTTAATAGAVVAALLLVGALVLGQNWRDGSTKAQPASGPTPTLGLPAQTVLP